MNIVAEECKVKKHHPEWSNVSVAVCFLGEETEMGKGMFEWGTGCWADGV